MTRAFALLLCSAAVCSAANPDPKSLAIPADVTARAAELVAKLDDRDFHDRDDATRELKKLGRLALPTLLDTLARNTHPEVRLRVEILLPAATSAEMKARVDCFLADKDGKFQHDLPGAKPFFAAIGRSDAAKQLFSDMIRSANRDLIVAVEGPENDLRQKYTERRTDLNIPINSGIVRGGDQTNAMNVVDMCALLFAEARLPDRGSTTVGVGAARTLPLISNYQFQTTLQAALNNDPRKEALSAVLTHWMETRDQAYSIYTAVNFMNRFNLPHALPAARKLTAGKVGGAAGATFYRGYAITYVARFGNADDLTALEGLFEDKGLLTTVFVGGGPGGNKQTRIQVRDLALAMALTITKQTPSDYGLTYRYAGNTTDSLKYNYSAYHFDADDEEKADEKRAAAVKKYTEWKAAQKKKEPEKKGEEKKDDKKEPGK